MYANGRAFQATEATQNAAVTGSAATITFVSKTSDLDGAVRVANIGTQTVFIRLDGTTPTTSTGIPLLAGTAEVFSVPTGSTTVKHIAAATGSTIYVTPGRGV
jgi:hypothetical protein